MAARKVANSDQLVMPKKMQPLALEQPPDVFPDLLLSLGELIASRHPEFEDTKPALHWDGQPAYREGAMAKDGLTRVREAYDRMGGHNRRAEELVRAQGITVTSAERWAFGVMTLITGRAP